MAGWHADGELKRRSMPRLRALRRAEQPAPLLEPEAEGHLPAERMSLVAAYIGAYPEDADERTNCKRLLNGPPEQRVEAAAG